MSTTSEQSTSSYSPSRTTTSSMEQVSKAMVKERVQQKPEWIEGFLRAKFSVACATHPYIANPLNRYCITCRIPGCQFCISPGNRHSDHETFQVYRHSNRDAVLLNEMQKHFDCSGILPYKRDRSLVIALKPLPHLGGLSKFMCKTCGRRISYPYSYCCLYCKVEVMASRVSSSAPPLLGDQNSPNNRENKKRVAEPDSSLNRRKGKAFRAPFF
uniref:uncharacterized protein LOC101296434 isoform X2 n=1 Tax=Fragaria vesca subsp. vesca TaxID=101020 RepID=UPI0005C8A13F|nr:PREDICTED: uncharacterized protein LOC101296434 isoform X2 [Fragaria vesca subsp. vesca]